MTSRSFTGLKCKVCGSENLKVLNPDTIYTWKTGATTGLVITYCMDCHWNTTHSCGSEGEDEFQEVAEEATEPGGGSGEPDTLLASDERGTDSREADTKPASPEKTVKKTTLFVRNECPSKPGLWVIGG